MSKGKFEMKSVMTWVKSRWSLVAFAVVALLLVPAMVYFAMSMTESKRAAFEKQVQDDAKDFNGTNINYTVPGLFAGDPGITQSHAPNEAFIKVFKEARDAQQAAAAGVVSEAVKFNKGEGDRLHKPLVDGVFPNPPANDQVLSRQFRRLYVGEAVRGLLETIKAKGPIPTAQLAQVLREAENNFLLRELGTDAQGGVARLSEEKQKALTTEMVSLRINQYRLWGQQLSVYADANIFTLPAVVEANTPSPQELWDWQVQYWTMQDIMRAVASANASARDQGVTKSVVKRIERLTIDPEAAAQPGSIDPATGQPSAPAAGGDSTADYTKSITGRKSGPLYDVRFANMTCVVATKDLPKFFDTLSQSNLMTVTRVKLSSVDQTIERREGYYYGDDHVTRAEITIESVWLREWTKELMPKEVKVALGLEAPAPDAAGGTPVPGAPADAPPPSGKRPGGSAGG